MDMALMVVGVIVLGAGDRLGGVAQRRRASSETEEATRRVYEEEEREHQRRERRRRSLSRSRRRLRCRSRSPPGSQRRAGRSGVTSARCWRRRARRAQRPARRADRRRQDAGRLPAEPRRAGREPDRRAAHALRLAAEGARGRRPAQPARPDRGDGPADPGRDPHRRHAVGPQGAPAGAAAANAADHARIAEPAAQPRGQLPLFADLSTVVVDEIHAFATGKRGDLSALALSRLQRIAPGLRRVGLSATDRRSRSLSRLAGAGGRCRDGRRWCRAIPAPSRDISIMLPEDERIPGAAIAAAGRRRR